MSKESVIKRRAGTVARRIPALLGTLIVLSLSLIMPANAAITSYDQLDENTVKKVVEPLWKELRSAGWTAESAAGVLGNVAQESSFDPLLINSIGCVGIVQWCPPPHNQIPSNVQAAFDAGDFDRSAKEQISEVMKIIQTGDWIDPYYNARYYQQVPGGKNTETLESFKAQTDIPQAVMIFLAWERPCSSDCSAELGSRIAQAKIIYDALKDVNGSPSAEATEESPSSVNLGGILKEDDLVGMPQIFDLTDGATKVDLPAAESLGVAQNYALEELQEQNLANQKTLGDYLKMGVSFVGVLLMFWSLFILMAGLFDYVNTFIPFKLLPALTFGKREFAPDVGRERVAGQIGWLGLFTLAAVGCLFGVVIVQGVIFDLLNWVYGLWQS